MIVVHAASAQHRPGDAGIDRQFGGEFADILCARDQDFIRDDQFFELIEEPREASTTFRARSSQPGGRSTRQPPNRM